MHDNVCVCPHCSVCLRAVGRIHVGSGDECTLADQPMDEQPHPGMTAPIMLAHHFAAHRWMIWLVATTTIAAGDSIRVNYGRAWRAIVAEPHRLTPPLLEVRCFFVNPGSVRHHTLLARPSSR